MCVLKTACPRLSVRRGQAHNRDWVWEKTAGRSSIGDNGFESLGSFHHLLNLLQRRYATNEVLLIVGLFQLWLQVFWHAVTEFLHGVHAGSFQKFSKLRTYALDAEEVCMVGPAEDEFVTDVGLLCQLLAAFGSCTLARRSLTLMMPTSVSFFA